MQSTKNKKGKKRSKHFNIMVYTNIENGAPRFYKISKILVSSILTVTSVSVLLFFIVSGIFINKYISVSGDLNSLEDLRVETARQKLHIEQFARMVKSFEGKLVKLERFDKKLRVITSLNSSDTTARAEKLAVGGPDESSNQRLSYLIGKNTNAALKRLSNDLEHLRVTSDRQLLSFTELDTFFKEQSTLLSSIPTIWPVNGWVTSGFGYRKSPFTNLREAHEGLDIAVNIGVEIVAPADGIVIREKIESGYGKMLEIDHGYGIVTRYGHNSKHMVKVGEKVKRGQVIAAVGNTGRSTGPHLHYAIVLNGVPVNPLGYILEED